MALTRIKICGLTRAADVDAAVAAGADFFGFIHVPKSPRYVPLQALQGLLERIPADRKRVLVVQDAPPQQLDDLAARLTFDYFQFHGSEPAALVNRYPGYKVIHVRQDQWDPKALEPYPDLVMFDTDFGHLRGGSGRTFDWQILRSQERPFLVAGGLNPKNVAQLVQEIRPWGVDVSSGIEKTPGVKDHTALTQFISQVRSAES